MAVNQQTQTSRLDRRFDALKNKVEQEAGAVNQQRQEALARKGAATGAGSSGAFMKLGEKVSQEGEAAKRNAVMDVEGQREGAQAALDEQYAQRDFAKAEREASQGFAQGMAREQMGFSREERLGSQAFQSSEAAQARGFSKQLFDKEMDFKQRMQSDANAQFYANLERVDRQFWEDNRISDFNMDMARKEFNKKDIMESAQNMFGYDPRTGGATGGGLGRVYGAGANVGSQLDSRTGRTTGGNVPFRS